MAISYFHASDYFTGFMILLLLLSISFAKASDVWKKWEQKLLYAGKMVSAEIRNVRQTGLLVNDQPEVRFDVSYANEKELFIRLFIKRLYN